MSIRQSYSFFGFLVAAAVLKASASFFGFLVTAAVLKASAQLTPDFYDEVCPDALPVIRGIVYEAIQREPGMGASLLRLHFHDCFVNGCDGSNLLDDTETFTGEKTAGPNINSLRGFEVVDEIKAALNIVCYGNVVSCADILAVAARDSIAILGGPSYQVLLGRKDARTASFNDANTDIPSPFLNFSQLLDRFQSHGLNLEDLVVLSGGHTIGRARCSLYLPRITNGGNINAEFRASLQKGCPNVAAQNNNTAPLDETTTRFDTAYFHGLLQFKGLLHSDQELYKGDGSASDGLVRYYSNNRKAFWADFAVSMIKMGSIKPLTGQNGEIRSYCRRVN